MSQVPDKYGRKNSDRFEETVIAIILGLMAIITFSNVVIRKLQEFSFWRSEAFAPVTGPLSTFGLLSLELTVFLFAWLVLLGASYCVKQKAHLGVDLLTAPLAPKPKRIFALIAVTCSVFYAFLLLKGSWDYWANFANLPATTGRWFPTGFEDKFLPKAWYEVDDVNMPGFLQFIADWMNDGERYEKVPRFIPYFVLPFGMALLLYRFLQTGLQIYRGETDSIIVAHEVEEITSVDNSKDNG